MFSLEIIWPPEPSTKTGAWADNLFQAPERIQLDRKWRLYQDRLAVLLIDLEPVTGGIRNYHAAPVVYSHRAEERQHLFRCEVPHAVALPDHVRVRLDP